MKPRIRCSWEAFQTGFPDIEVHWPPGDPAETLILTWWVHGRQGSALPASFQVTQRCCPGTHVGIKAGWWSNTLFLAYVPNSAFVSASSEHPGSHTTRGRKASCSWPMPLPVLASSRPRAASAPPLTWGSRRQWLLLLTRVAGRLTPKVRPESLVLTREQEAACSPGRRASGNPSSKWDRIPRLPTRGQPHQQDSRLERPALA